MVLLHATKSSRILRLSRNSIYEITLVVFILFWGRKEIVFLVAQKLWQNVGSKFTLLVWWRCAVRGRGGVMWGEDEKGEVIGSLSKLCIWIYIDSRIYSCSLSLLAYYHISPLDFYWGALSIFSFSSVNSRNELWATSWSELGRTRVLTPSTIGNGRKLWWLMTRAFFGLLVCVQQLCVCIVPLEIQIQGNAFPRHCCCILYCGQFVMESKMLLGRATICLVVPLPFDLLPFLNIYFPSTLNLVK